MTINVILVDDHPIVRAGMKAVLAVADDIHVQAEGCNAAQALELTRLHNPDVLVLDVNLPDQSGLAVTRQLRGEGHDTAILILTVHNDPHTIFGLLENGATGYVLKDEALETLVNAVRIAARGETWLSPSIAGQVVQRAVSGKNLFGEPLHSPELAELTPRELEILRLLAQGLDNAAIADQLVVTRRTVQNHVSNIYGKLGVNSRTEAALLAIRTGISSSPAAGNPGDAH